MIRREQAAVGVITLLFCASFVFPFSHSSLAFDRPAESSVDVIESLKHHIDREPYQPPPTLDNEVEVVVPINGGTIPSAHSENYSGSFVLNHRSTENGQRYAHGSMAMSDVRPFLKSSHADRIRITDPTTAGDGRIASGVSEIAAERLHQRGLTGENVTVGIIDSDFRPSHPAVASQVRGYATIDPNGDGKHGTAVASVIADTAPNATLQLAAVGTTTTAEEYAAAVKWLQRSGADIIVDAGSYYAHPGNRTSNLTRIAQQAASETVFITSVGNHAERYWSGNRSTDSWVSFRNDTQINPLNNGEPLSGSVRLTLRWDSWPTTETNYDLYLLRAQPGTDAVVAQATGHDGRPFEHLQTTVPEGQYYVSIRSESDTATMDRLELFANQELQYRSRGGRAAPATARGVIAVGAVDNGAVKSFSARGADVVAPDLVAIDGITVEDGTSFSTPYVAGTAALVLAANPGATPTEVRTTLFLTAEDVGANGIDERSGYGMVNATRAIDSQSNEK
ncbi:S8 family serine peptidase [Halocatena pleomorpha]|uniref:Peptidase S8/S53 domain-containing protein n=1 Tax=Halocatena pleomorpha TaxID=1785090 RepID=A0A3P3RI88_9EURY|nr:S8 family serine peptidase [Halocatena pleomorpha]RRJ33122.1 hypothetical protein EIK79_03600 [Halocatena pleomorpha]